MKAISFFQEWFWIDFRFDIFHLNEQRRGSEAGEGRAAALCSFASSDKGLVVSDTFTAKFTPEWQKQVLLGLPDTCAQGSRILRPDDQGGKAWVFIEKESRQRSPNWGVSLQSQLVWLYSTGIFLPVRVWTTKPSAGADGYNFLEKQKGAGEFQLPKCIFLISKSSFCYLGRGTAEVPTFRKLMRPLESEPTNPTVGFPGVESRAVTIWQFFRGKNKVFF